MERRQPRLRELIPLAALAGCVALSAPLADAREIEGDVRAGYNAEVEDALVGGGVRFDVGRSGRWAANPNVEMLFADGGDQLSISGDMHYGFPMKSATYWLGAGPAIVHRDYDFGGDDTDLGVNLLAGIGARETADGVRAFVQGRVTLMDDTEAALTVGIRF